LFTEAALLTVIGCALASFLVVVLLRGFVHYAAGELPRLNEVSVNARVFTVGLLLAILTTLLFGALPALRCGRLDIQNVLQEAGRLGLSSSYRLTKRALVIAEIALSLLLLSGAALLLQTLWHLRNDRLGFQPEHR
jgi:putative ABC transport system permease protein